MLFVDCVMIVFSFLLSLLLSSLLLCLDDELKNFQIILFHVVRIDPKSKDVALIADAGKCAVQLKLVI